MAGTAGLARLIVAVPEIAGPIVLLEVTVQSLALAAVISVVGVVLVELVHRRVPSSS